MYGARSTNDQISFQRAFSPQLKLLFKLALVGLGACPIPIPDQDHGLTVPSLLVPQHYWAAGVIVAAADGDCGVLLHYLRKTLMDTIHLTCGQWR